MSQMHIYRACSFAGDAPQCHAVAAPRCNIMNRNQPTLDKSCYQHAYELYVWKNDMLRFAADQYVSCMVVVFWNNALDRLESDWCEQSRGIPTHAYRAEGSARRGIQFLGPHWAQCSRLMRQCKPCVAVGDLWASCDHTGITAPEI